MSRISLSGAIKFFRRQLGQPSVKFMSQDLSLPFSTVSFSAQS